MEWVIGTGVVVGALVFLWIHARAGGVDPRAGEETEPRPYQWGDEIAEFSYRHPWDDEI